MRDPRLIEATQLLAERSGVTVPPYRLPLLAAELERLGQGQLDRGLAVFRDSDQALVEHLAGIFAVSETYLFRGPEHFRELRRLAQRAAERGLPFRVLCAGVSTGEEAWSAVLVLAATHEPAKLPYCVVGWELSRERLQRANLARFGRWSTRSGLMGYDRYLIETEDGYEVDPRLRRHAKFEHVNLTRPLPVVEHAFDAIFFRNVSIYWRPRQASEVAEALGQRLAPGGRLFIGPSDPIELPSQEWRGELIGASLSYRRLERVPAPASAARTSPPVPATTAAARAEIPRPASSPSSMPLRVAASPASARVADGLAEHVRKLADRGDYEQALALLEGRDSSPPELLELAGIVHLSRGELDVAIDRFRAAVYWAPAVPTYARWLELAISNRERLAERWRLETSAGAPP